MNKQMTNNAITPALRVITDGRMREQRIKVLEERFLDYIVKGVREPDNADEYYKRLMDADQPFRSKGNLKAVGG